jgi:anti-sigma28 factor (negative regulator of flagellin synthesis)
MKIGPVDSGNRPHRPEDGKKQRPDVEQNAQQEMNRTDKVEISSSARTLSETESAATEEISDAENQNRPERIEELRKKIESGHYDSDKVKKEIARRITDDFVG